MRVLLVLGVSAAMAASAEAQSFTYSAWTGTTPIPWTLDSDDAAFPPDVFGQQLSRGAAFTPLRYGPNINYRIRVVGNPYVRDVGLTFASVTTITTPVSGVSDSVRLGWYDGTGSTLVREGLWGAHSASIGASGANSAMLPGVLFNFVTGPSVLPGQPYGESEADGFRVTHLRVTGGSLGNWNQPTLAAHERVVGVLRATDDTVRMRLPGHATARATVNLWLENPDTNLVTLWARCGAQPTAATAYASNTTWNAAVYPNWQGASLDLPPCTAGWNLAVTNTSTTNRVFHMTWGLHEPGYELSAIRIGVAFVANDDELALIRTNFQAAAWRLLAETGGSRMIRDFRLINNANQCDDGFPSAYTACEGGGCDFCLVTVNTGQPYGYGICRARAFDTGVALCRDNWSSGPDVISHEMGHRFLGLPDEYVDVNLSCPIMTNDSLWLCRSHMASNGAPGFCTDLDHRRPSADYRGYPPAAANEWVPATNDIITYDCAGGAYWTNTSSMWSVVNNYAPIDHPMTWTASRLTMPGFWGDSMSGWFSRLQ